MKKPTFFARPFLPVFSSFLTVFSLLACLLCAGVSHAADEAIAKVLIMVPGATLARNGQNMTLEKSALLYVSDTIMTNATGRVRVLFNDDSSVDLGANTSLDMRAFADSGAKPVFNVHLLQGVARVVTGKIVEQNPGGFTVTTPEGTIGIRGTIISARTENGVTTVYVENTTRSVYVNNVHVPSGQKITIPRPSRPEPISPQDRRDLGRDLAFRGGAGVAAAAPEPILSSGYPEEQLRSGTLYSPLADASLSTQRLGDSLAASGTTPGGGTNPTNPGNPVPPSPTFATYSGTLLKNGYSYGTLSFTVQLDGADQGKIFDATLSIPSGSAINYNIPPGEVRTPYLGYYEPYDVNFSGGIGIVNSPNSYFITDFDPASSTSSHPEISLAHSTLDGKEDIVAQLSSFDPAGLSFYIRDADNPGGLVDWGLGTLGTPPLSPPPTQAVYSGTLLKSGYSYGTFQFTVQMTGADQGKISNATLSIPAGRVIYPSYLPPGEALTAYLPSNDPYSVNFSGGSGGFTSPNSYSITFDPATSTSSRSEISPAHSTLDGRENLLTPPSSFDPAGVSFYIRDVDNPGGLVDLGLGTLRTPTTAFVQGTLPFTTHTASFAGALTYSFDGTFSFYVNLNSPPGSSNISNAVVTGVSDVAPFGSSTQTQHFTQGTGIATSSWFVIGDSGDFFDATGMSAFSGPNVRLQGAGVNLYEAPIGITNVPASVNLRLTDSNPTDPEFNGNFSSTLTIDAQ